MPMELIVPFLRIDSIANLIEENIVHTRLEYLMGMEEEKLIATFHQNVQKSQQKFWHDRHIKTKDFQP